MTKIADAHLVLRLAQRRPLWYAAVVVIAALARFSVSRTRLIGFDEAWDIFVSRQDSLSAFFRAVAATSHPPGFYALLHFTAQLGSAQIVDPLLSVFCGLTAIVFLGKILRILEVRFAFEIAAMCAAALAQSHILISVIVRPYSLANCLMLVSFYFGLRLVNGRYRSRRDWDLFYLSLSASFLSHYSALLYAAALGAAYAGVLLLFPVEFKVVLSTCASRREFLRVHRAGLLCGLGFLAYLALSAQGGLFLSKSLLATNDPLQLTPYRYLSSYLYSGKGGILGFILSALGSEWNLFSPLPVANRIGAAALLLFVLFGLLGAAAWISKDRVVRDVDGRPVARALVFITPVMAIVVLAVLGGLGKYPFGGELRQQFFVFNFLFLGVVCAADELVRGDLPVVLFTGTLLFISTARFAIVPLDDEEFGKLPALNRLRAAIHDRSSLYLGTWTAFTFYGQNRDWQLHAAGRVGSIQRFVLRRGTEEMQLLVDPRVYFNTFPTEGLPERIRDLMQSIDLSELFVVGFPEGRIKCELCGRKKVERALTAELGAVDYQVQVIREQTKNKEGFAIVTRGGSTQPASPSPSS